MRDGATDAVYWSLDEDDGTGRIQAETFGNGATTRRTYSNVKDRVRGIKTKATGETIQSLSYGYDARLNPTQRTDLLQGKSEHFGYDLLDRLTVASFGPGGQELRTYSYQPNGNLALKLGLGIYTYDPARPHTVEEAGGETYAYDAVGNQIARPGATIAYTGFDLPFGGSPTDPANKIALTPQQHAPATNWWNGLQRWVQDGRP